MQHQPLGKASKKLHKSAMDRVNKPIAAMLGGTNQKGKPNSLPEPGHQRPHRPVSQKEFG
jgi:hypothetical protein